VISDGRISGGQPDGHGQPVRDEHLTIWGEMTMCGHRDKNMNATHRKLEEQTNEID
jgi:hypothetical protein